MKFILLIFIFLLASCSRAKIYAVNLLAARHGQTIHRDISYANEERQKLNIYTPQEKSSALKPVIIFLYGGGWESGSKDDYRFLAEPFVSNDYIVAIPDYAKYPDFKYPVFAYDAALAVSWIHQNIKKYGGDPDRLLIIGHSAGAHIGGLISLDAHYLQDLQVPADAIKGFVGLSGAYDFVPEKPSYVAVFSPIAGNLAVGMPATYFTDTKLPVLLIHGGKDHVIDISNITSMQKQAEKHQLNLDVKFYPQLDHIGTIAAFSIPMRSKSTVLNDVMKFCADQTKKEIFPVPAS